MIVAGGIYGEECIVPGWRQIFGSGGRAAAALSRWCDDTTLAGYCPEPFVEDVYAIMAAFGVEVAPRLSSHLVRFHYFHPLSEPEIVPPTIAIPRQQPIHVDGDVVLRFGMMEGEAVVNARKAVFDPQSGIAPESFRANGSSAEQLAIVLNEGELHLLTRMERMEDAAPALLDAEKADVLVVKAGTRGATVWSREGRSFPVPVYRSDRVFKIGSGDIFSAAFAWFWGSEGKEPEEAADLASRWVAWYCETKQVPLPALEELSAVRPVPVGKPGRIYLAGPFFDMGQRWVVEEALACLKSLGAQVFSPLHEVGFDDAAVVAKKDLQGLEGCDAVLAIVNGSDPGTLFEVGYARKKGIPVVALAEDVHERDLTMIAGSGCEVAPDLTSAIYRAVWASMA